MDGGTGHHFFWDIINWIWVGIIVPAFYWIFKIEGKIKKAESDNEHLKENLQEVKNDIRQIRENTFELLKEVRKNVD